MTHFHISQTVFLIINHEQNLGGVISKTEDVVSSLCSLVLMMVISPRFVPHLHLTNCNNDNSVERQLLI